VEGDGNLDYNCVTTGKCQCFMLHTNPVGKIQFYITQSLCNVVSDWTSRCNLSLNVFATAVALTRCVTTKTHIPSQLSNLRDF